MLPYEPQASSFELNVGPSELEGGIFEPQVIPPKPQVNPFEPLGGPFESQAGPF